MNQSEWHEQVDFSDLYFKTTMVCRTHQAEDRLLAWKFALESKITLIKGILNAEEKKETYFLKSQINKVWSKYYNEEKRIGKRLHPLHPICSDFRSTLDIVEEKVDSLVNSRMPFLNIKKKVDIRGL